MNVKKTFKIKDSSGNFEKFYPRNGEKIDREFESFEDARDYLLFNKVGPNFIQCFENPEVFYLANESLWYCSPELRKIRIVAVENEEEKRN